MDIELPGGVKLFVPDALRGARELPLALHLHGAHSAVKEAFLAGQVPGAVASLTLPGLSDIYKNRFLKDPARELFGILGEIQKASGAGGFSRVWLSSFSAGFGGVRELLRSPEVISRLDALILADTLYAGFARPQTGPEDRPPPEPKNLEDFLRYARLAADGKRAMLMTCCDLLPPTYAATRETARALCEGVGATIQTVRDAWPEDLTRTATARRGRFAFHGFDGDDGKAHLRHLRGLRFFWRLMPRA